MSFSSPSTIFDYRVPEWARNRLLEVPKHGRLRLANLPTPLQKIDIFPQKNDEGNIFNRLRELNITLVVKRDDMTGGVELGGNKIRKLEFLLADAISKNCNEAAACRMVGVQPNLILRTKSTETAQSESKQLGITGNILFDRIVGANIYTCSPGEYGRIGSVPLVQRLCRYLEESSSVDTRRKKVYEIPVGGSNGLGTWGYIAAVEEIMTQSDDIGLTFDHVVVASGSGGTAAGISLGMILAHHGFLSSTPNMLPHIHAVGVCDNPDYFYKTILEIFNEMGLSLQPSFTENLLRKYLTVHQGKGLGYGFSTKEELAFIAQFAIETGIALDPVYTGKALYHFILKVLENGNQEVYRNSTILFWHTGGGLGIFEKGDSLLDILDKRSSVQKLDVYGKGNADVISI